MCSTRRKSNKIVLTDVIKNTVYEALKCYICEEFCHPPFNQALEGYLVCSTCLQICINEPERLFTKERNFLLEKMYPHLELSCTYSRQGCSFKGKGAKLQEHHKFCKFVSTYCHAGGCHWRGRLKDIFLHCRSHHRCMVGQYESNIKEITFHKRLDNFKIELSWIMAFDVVFAFYLINNTKTGTRSYILTNLEPCDVANFEWSINLIYYHGIVKTVALKLTHSNNIMNTKILKMPQLDLPLDDTVRCYKINITKQGFL